MIIAASKLLRSFASPVLDNGAVVVSNGVIVVTGGIRRLRSIFPHHRVITLPHAVLMPGLVNTHTHLELPPLRGLVRAEHFVEWVLKLIAQKKHLSVSNYTEAVCDNIRTLIETGTTTVGEISTHGISRPLLMNSGLRGIVFQEIISMKPGECPAMRTLAPLPRHGSLLANGISPHSPYTVSECVLRQIAAHSERSGFRIAIHVAESQEELKLLQRKRSAIERLYRLANWEPFWAPAAPSSFEYLNAAGVLSPRVLAVHAVHANDRDIRLIQRRGVSIAHCPRSNSELHVGTMNLRRFLDANIPVGLGTDSLASSPSLSMWDEMRYAWKIHKRAGVAPADIMKLATLGGAKALGLDKMTGTLQRGKRADIIAVPLPQRNTGDLYCDLIRETKYSIMTQVNGKILHRLR